MRMHGPLLSRVAEVALTTLLVASGLLIQTSSQVGIDVQFTIHPGNITVPETTTDFITYNCTVVVSEDSGTPLRRHWSLKFPDVTGSFSTMDIDNVQALAERGIVYEEATALLTVQQVVGNNCTLISCTVRPNGITELSAPVKLTTAGPPLPPAPVLTIPCASQIEVQWEVPFSHENFSVESYTVSISNTTSNAVLVANSTLLSSFVYQLDGADQATSCHLLNFSVAAINSVGTSGPGTVMGGFPIAPRPFESDIKVDVTFQKDGTPMADISFEAPFICDFQTSTYTIQVEDTTLPEAVAVVFEQTVTYTGSDRMVMLEVNNGQLATNSNYVVTVVVSDERYDGNVTNSTTFNTAFDPMNTHSPSSGTRGVEIYAGIAGGIVALLLLSITLIAMVLIYSRRKRQHPQAPGSSMEKRLNNSISWPDQLDNDLFIIPPRPMESASAHAAAPVYEAINDYQLTPERNRNTDALSRQWQDYRKLQQLDRERTEKEDLEDSTYQVMNSASQDAAGNSAGNQLPSYPGQQPQLHTNTSSQPATWSQGAPNQPHTPDNNHPYDGYHFRRCPPISEAPLLLSSAPARERQSDPTFQHYTVNQTSMDAPAPPINREEEEGGEGVGGGGVGSREGVEEQDYTFMSQAGTLAGLDTERVGSAGQPRGIRVGVSGVDKNILVSEC